MDTEMQDAVKELEAAMIMYGNAHNNYRIDEASYRIKAAQERIQAILFERNEENVQKMATEAKG